MATDGPTPPPCNEKIFREGEHVFTLHSLGSNAIERWVKRVAELSGQPVDWHFVGGRAVVRALGDIEKVRMAVEELRPEYERQIKDRYPCLY